MRESRDAQMKKMKENGEIPISMPSLLHKRVRDSNQQSQQNEGP